MVTTDAAGIFAQVYPVALLIMVFEGRSLRAHFRTGTPRFFKGFAYFAVGVTTVAVLAILSAESFALTIVGTGHDGTNGVAGVVFLITWLLTGLSIAAIVGTALGDQVIAPSSTTQ